MNNNKKEINTMTLHEKKMRREDRKYKKEIKELHQKNYHRKNKVVIKQIFMN